MIRLIPPVAVPLRPLDVARSLFAPADESRFAEALAERCHVPQASLFPSGRAALSQYLTSFGTDDRDEVVVPAYTCWSVAASVVNAGLRVRLVDVDPQTLDVPASEWEQVPLDRARAVVTAHLFARTADVDRAAQVTRARDAAVRVIEDAAQTWPGREVSPADVTLLSFGRGKPLPLGSGGALLLPEPSRTPAARPAALGGIKPALALVATTMLARPAWYRIPESIPFLGIGRTVYDSDFGTDGAFLAWRGRLGLSLLERLDEWQQRRREHAAGLHQHVDRLDGWSAPLGSDASPIRFPVLAPDRATRDRTIRELRGRGVAASAMYPGTLPSIPELHPHLANPRAQLPGAEAVADRLIALPVYPTLAAREIEHIGSALVDSAQVADPS